MAGPASLAVAREPDDAAVEKLFEIHTGLGAAWNGTASGRPYQMLADHRMAVELHVERIYGQILDG